MAHPTSQSLHFSSPQEEEINIYLKVIKTVPMKVKRSETIGNIKSLLCEKEGISEGFHQLFFNGNMLNDDQRVVDYGILKDSTLRMILQNSVRMKVVIPSRQKSIVVEARTYETIKNIKSMILDMEGILPDQYNLIFAGKILEDDWILASLNMQSESTVHLFFNPKDTLTFSVITPNGDIEKLKVKVLYSVSDVKAIVGGLTGIPVSDFGLSYEGKQLEDSKSLVCYNIQEGSMLNMSSLKFQIFVKAWSGKTITLDVHQNDTVQDVKEKVFQKIGGPQYFQSVLFCGKRLEVDRNLAHYNIPTHATLHMVCSPSTITTKMTVSEIRGALGVPNSTTSIHGLKTMIKKICAAPVKEIYFCGKPLKDEHSVAHYRIGIHDTLTVVSEARL